MLKAVQEITAIQSHPVAQVSPRPAASALGFPFLKIEAQAGCTQAGETLPRGRGRGLNREGGLRNHASQRPRETPWEQSPHRPWQRAGSWPLEAPAPQIARWPPRPTPRGPHPAARTPLCKPAQGWRLGARGGAGAEPRRAGAREERREGVGPREAARGGGRGGRVLEAELRAGTGSFAAIFCPTKQPIGDGSQPGLHWRFVSRFGQ